MNRAKLEIIYSIIVIIAIPAIVIANTVLFTMSINDSYVNIELGRKAELANNIIAETTKDIIKDKKYTELQDKIISLEESEPVLTATTIIIQSDGKAKVIAKSKTASGKVDQTLAALVFSSGNPMQSLIDTYDHENNKVQAVRVMTPVFDGEKIIAVVSAGYLTVDAQEAISSVYQQSFIVLIISTIVILALLFRHFRLVGYAQLLAKQREVNQTMADFLSVATHELKAPTTIIKGYLSNVVEGDFGEVNPEIKEQIDIALSQTDRLNSLVQDLLNVSRVEQGRVQYTLTSVDTVKIISTIVNNYKPIAEEKGLQLTYEPTTDLPLVHADEGRVQEVFTNLIDNAIKYTTKGSVIITQQAKKNRLVTGVRDTGFGISPEARQRLFQRFYRVKTEQTATISGTGLGLWIIKQYIEAMGGSIDVETMENVGSNFIVELEIAPKSK